MPRVDPVVEELTFDPNDKKRSKWGRKTKKAFEVELDHMFSDLLQVEGYIITKLDDEEIKWMAKHPILGAG